jgi:hypothetical protein
MCKQNANGDGFGHVSPLAELPGVCRWCGGELSFGHECQIEKWCGDEAGELPADGGSDTARVSEPMCTTDECVALYREVSVRAARCVELAQTKLWPASSTDKRKAATRRLVKALGELQVANAELFAALADVEDAV